MLQAGNHEFATMRQDMTSPACPHAFLPFTEFLLCVAFPVGLLFLLCERESSEVDIIVMKSALVVVLARATNLLHNHESRSACACLFFDRAIVVNRMIRECPRFSFWGFLSPHFPNFV
jgi:hypothetical protein